MKTINTLFIKIGLICLFVLLFQAVNPLSAQAVMSCNSSGSCFYTSCNSNSDCQQSKFVDQQYCQGNNLYQNYVTNTCNNPGSAYSSCTSSKSPRLVQSCSKTCEENLWYIGCSENNPTTNTTNTNNTCFSHSYQKCSGNSVYWFDSCNNKQDLYQTCSSGQICSGNSCQTNYITNYNLHAIKGCVNNNVYWYDSLGNQQDLYQNCSTTGQVCQDGKCVTGKTTYVTPVSTTTKTIETTTADCTNTQSTVEPPQTESNLTAAVSENPVAGSLKKWFVWLMISAVLIFLFITIFRKLSSNV